jgi:hypothetical protein
MESRTRTSVPHPSGSSPIALIGWVLTTAICMFVAENLWIAPWLRDTHRRLSFVPEALTGIWFLVLVALVVALILAVTCHLFLIKDPRRGAWKRVLSGAAALATILLCAEWIAVTSGMAADIWSAVDKHHHSVILHWNASTTSNVIGYNIYRGTKQGKHEKRLNSTPVNGLTFTDADAKSGKTYYYVARSVNGAGKESIDSNETSAPIP